MKITMELSLENFEAWAGAVDTKKKIIGAGMEDDFNVIIEACYPDGLTETQLNDLLWFDADWILEALGIKEE